MSRFGIGSVPAPFDALDADAPGQGAIVGTPTFDPATDETSGQYKCPDFDQGSNTRTGLTGAEVIVAPSAEGGMNPYEGIDGDENACRNVPGAISVKQTLTEADWGATKDWMVNMGNLRHGCWAIVFFSDNG